VDTGYKHAECHWGAHWRAFFSCPLPARALRSAPTIAVARAAARSLILVFRHWQAFPAHAVALDLLQGVDLTDTGLDATTVAVEGAALIRWRGADQNPQGADGGGH
jgi:hypothetical protein